MYEQKNRSTSTRSEILDRQARVSKQDIRRRGKEPRVESLPLPCARANRASPLPHSALFAQCIFYVVVGMLIEISDLDGHTFNVSGMGTDTAAAVDSVAIDVGSSGSCMKLFVVRPNERSPIPHVAVNPTRPTVGTIIAMSEVAADHQTGGVGTDTAAAAAGVDVVATDSSSSGTPSRRGSATSTAADQKLGAVAGEPDVYGEQHFRRRSSMMAPLAGGNNDGLESTSGDGTTPGTLTSDFTFI